MNPQRQPAAGAVRALQSALRAALAGASVAAAMHALPAAAQHAPGHMAAAPAAASAAAAAAAVFAKVGSEVISAEQYEAAFAQAARSKFYHGKPPEGELALLQREVGQKLVDEILLKAEIARRNIRPDAASVQKTIASYDERYKDSAQWKANREKVLPGLVARLEQDNLIEQLTAQVKTLPDPTPQQLQQYYEQNKDKFTSPEQVHIRIILLKVDPSAPKAQWIGAVDEGTAITRRLRAGADFTELAHLHSGDESAKKGGDMGFVHRGMLPEAAQQALDRARPGDTTDPVTLLEGVAVFRLEGRKEPVLNPLDAVRKRAQDLYLRDQGEAAWTALLEKLRRDTPVQLDDSRFLPLASSASEGPPAR